jgi:hypothetical protein
MHAGDMDVARGFLDAAIQDARDRDNPGAAAIGLRNLVECLGWLGHTPPAIAVAEESLTHATATADRELICYAHAHSGWVADLAGDTAGAEHHFHTADHLEHTDDPDGDHLSSLAGVQWAGFLARTGRPGAARRLTTANLAISERYGWNEDVARCRLVLARLDLADRDFDTAHTHLQAALRTFRDGDFLVELAEALTVAADHSRRTGEHDRAADHLDEALALAGPRGLTATHADALTVRAHLGADRYTSTAESRHLFEGRDAADAALRLATGPYPLPWQQLAALQAHAHIDQVAPTDHDWARHAEQLQQRLIPTGLDPDPLTTIEDQVRRERDT